MGELTLGSAPGNEPCAQTIDDDYALRSAKECRIWAKQLGRVLAARLRELGIPRNSVDVKLVIASENHSEGVRREVAVRFNEYDPVAVDLAFWLDANAPAEWDLTALAQVATMLPRKETP